MQHFDMESTVFERGESLLYISVKKLFLAFSPILAYRYLPINDRKYGTFLYGRTHKLLVEDLVGYSS